MKIKRIILMLMFFCFITAAFSSCSESERPLTATELLNLGNRYLLELNYAQALVHFTSLIEVEPMNPRGYIGAAEAHVGLGQTAEAAIILERGLENTGSIDVANAWIELTPNDSQVYILIARIFMRLNLPAPARIVLQTGLERLASADIAWAWVDLDQDNSQTYLDIADLLLILGDTETAVAILLVGYERTGSAEIRELLIALDMWDGVLEDVALESEPIPQPTPITTTVGGTIIFANIEWRVLDVQNNRALLLSDLILERRSYNSAHVYITWEQSSMRRYLNNEFLNNRFNEDERARIANTTIINNDNPWSGTLGGNNTQDYIFLLSLEEVVRFFGDSGQLQNRPPSDTTILRDQFDDARIARNSEGTEWWWWLRSPGEVPDNAAAVNNGGGVIVDGFAIDSPGGGIRPALWLNLE